MVKFHILTDESHDFDREAPAQNTQAIMQKPIDLAVGPTALVAVLNVTTRTGTGGEVTMTERRVAKTAVFETTVMGTTIGGTTSETAVV